MSRNKDIKAILISRQRAAEQRKRIRDAQRKRRPLQYLTTGYIRSSTWPSNKR